MFMNMNRTEQNNKRILLGARKSERPLFTNFHNLLIINKHEKSVIQDIEQRTIKYIRIN